MRSRGLNQPDRTLAMAQAGAVLTRLGRDDVGRKLIDEAARNAAQLGIENRAGYYRGLVAQELAPFDVKQALALIEPIKDENNEKDRYRAMIATAIATTDTNQAVALVEKVGGRGFYHELARTEIAYKIGAEHPDEAIKIIEGMKREPRWDPRWQAEAFGWLAVAHSSRDRTRAFGLIDRAAAMMIDHRDWAGPDDERPQPPHRPLCRRIGYPDMEGVLRVRRPGRATQLASSDRVRLIESITEAAPSTLIDPGTARASSTRSRRGRPDHPGNAREPWLTAWALVDLKKAEALFEASLAALEGKRSACGAPASHDGRARHPAPPPRGRPGQASSGDSGGRGEIFESAFETRSSESAKPTLSASTTRST